jgi:signal peptidase I
MVGVPLLSVLAAVLVVTVPISRANLLPLLIPLGLRILAVVDAVRKARRPQAADARSWYSRWYVCVALAFSNAFLWLPVQAAVRTSLVQSFKIPTGAMEPTVVIGDHLYASKFAYGLRDPLTGAWLWRRREPRRGEVIVFRYPEDPSRVFIKRVVGLPGETIEIRARQVIVDGRPIVEPYARYLEDVPTAGRDSSWGPGIVPVAHFFVLGDNRDNSKDSRHWGSVPIDYVLGEARVVYFSVGQARVAWPRRAAMIRWDRLGKIVR